MPVYLWSTTAASNATADSTINWAEGMAPSAVNDSARAEMAAVAKWRNDISGANTTAGTSTAYTLTTSSVFDSLAHMDKALITFVAHTTSGASPTLAIDGLTAKAINGPSGSAIPTGALTSGNAYAVVYDNSNNQFLLLNYRDTLGNATITGTLAVTGATTFTGATTHNGGLSSTTGAFSGVLTQSSTSHGVVASGTTAQRPGSPTAANFRYNSTLGAVEFYDGAAWWPLTGGPVPAGFKNLLVVNNTGTPNTKMDVTADFIAVATTSNIAYGLNSVSVTINCATTGANGLDTGSLANATWYSIWIIYNPATATTAGLMSTSATAPTMPSGYTAKARLGWAITDGSAHFLRIRQAGRRAAYVIGTNPTALPTIQSGSSGNVSTPTWTAVSVSGLVPSTASLIDVVLSDHGTSTTVMLAPNNSYGNVTSNSNPPPLALSATGAINIDISGTLLLESTNVYYASDSSACAAFCRGWEDNI